MTAGNAAVLFARSATRVVGVLLSAAVLAGCLQDFSMFLAGDGGGGGDAPDNDASDVLTCAAGEVPCNGACVNTATSPNHCGTCGNVCPTHAGGSATCAEGQCGFACNEGFVDCDMSLANGCEANTATDALNCGTCGMRCMLNANAMPQCTDGTCGLACMPGYGNCLTAVQDGCETQLATDPNHCGMCRRACAATEACLGGRCVAMGSVPDAGAPMPAPQVLTACPAGTAPGVARDCGWTNGGTMMCTPGAIVQVGCAASCTPALGSCTGDTIIRVCAGTAPCVGTASIGANDDSPCASTLCSSTRVVCPPEGQITVLTQSWNSRPFTCMVATR